MKILGSASGPLVRGRYRHWDELRHLTPPDGLTAEEWWLAIKFARNSNLQALTLCDTREQEFVYTLPATAQELLHGIATDAAGQIRSGGKVSGAETGESYLLRSLIEEPITSSQLEGAATTREAAKEMLRQGRDPRDRSERMILNNHQAMQWVREVKGQALTPEMVFELHRIVTDGTLDNLDAAGRFRRPDLPDELIHVQDGLGNVLHRPPPAEQLAERMERMCAFANAEGDQSFVHPVVRAILLHFWLAYDHPFVDGNGRTARALFYWCVARHGYWLLEYVSISSILKRAPAKYARAFLFTETDGNDATYFVLHQLRTIRQAIDALHEYLDRKIAEVQETKRLVSGSTALRSLLNHRQLALLSHALRHPGAEYTIKGHQNSHGVTYQTARVDLLHLAELKLLDQFQEGRRFVFLAPSDLKERLEAVSSILH